MHTLLANIGAGTARVKDSLEGELVIIDLDHTLLRTDTLWEQLTWLVKSRPVTAVAAFSRLLVSSNRAAAKRSLALLVPDMPVDVLPVRVQLLEQVQRWREAGATTVLATATDEKIAQRVADHLPVFDEVIGSDGMTNLKGVRKLEELQRRYPGRGFVYAGDSLADLPIFKAAKCAILVNAPSSIRSQLRGDSVLEVQDSSRAWRAILGLMRPHHWVKNVLVFLPLIAGHRLTDVAAMLSALGAATAFSLMASAIYCLNDLLDVDADRRHRTKRLRPLAAGELSAPAALLLSASLAIASLALATAVGAAWIIAFYGVVNVAYSFHLKRKPVLDVMLLAGMYAMRVVAGGIAASIVLSSWLIAFSMFFFLALALAKRYTEIQTVAEDGWATGRGYAASDRVVVLAGGVAVSVAACLVLSLYITSPQVAALYAEPVWLWVAVPVALYWLLRLWLIAGRGALNDDPIVFALRDRVTYLAGAVTLLGVLAASR